MKIRVYLSKSYNTVRSISHSFEVGKDNVIYVGFGGVMEDDENIPKIFYNKGYYQCTVKSTSDTNQYRLSILE